MNEGRGYAACVVTYGCQQNEADSEKIAGMLKSCGYDIVKEASLADVIIVNTCAVREHAEERALSRTGGYKHFKAERPWLKIGICGCMVSKNDTAEKIKKSYPYVDFVFGTEKLSHMPEILYRTIEKGKRVFVQNDGETEIAEGLPVLRESNFRAWVSIMYGCNNFCTYCIVPYVRGRERSRRPEKIIEEVRTLVESGCREITLLGQNVNSYGKEFSGECDFSELLRRICEIEGDFLIRFMTSHPKDASRTLIDVMAENKKIARHFHLPVQSGSDRILKAMNRHYNRESYLSLVKYMREKMPDIAISTDIIVGFPGETEEDFEDTLSLMREVKYDMIFSFIYSRRTGTPAAEMEQVPDEIKSARMERLLRLQNELLAEKNEAYVGKTLRVLVEGTSKNDPKKMSARTEGNRIVLFDGDTSLTGKFIDLKITKSAPFALIGELDA
ncbi:MAG: tRNA (N6-isopentenyl adenosine(37)-C2)-methylthiotransferase MiaB [Eubacteriales bacterium]